MQIKTLTRIGSWNKIEIRTSLRTNWGSKFRLMLLSTSNVHVWIWQASKTDQSLWMLWRSEAEYHGCSWCFHCRIPASRAIIINVCCMSRFLKITCFSLSQSDAMKTVECLQHLSISSKTTTCFSLTQNEVIRWKRCVLCTSVRAKTTETLFSISVIGSAHLNESVHSFWAVLYIARLLLFLLLLICRSNYLNI